MAHKGTLTLRPHKINLKSLEGKEGRCYLPYYMDTLSLEFLKMQPLMEGLTDEELLKIQIFSRREEVDSDEVVITQGEISSNIYLILEGELTVYIWDEANLTQSPIRTLKEGDVFGEMSFRDAPRRSATLKTNKPTVLYSLSRERLLLPDMVAIYQKIINNSEKIINKRLEEIGNLTQYNMLYFLRKQPLMQGMTDEELKNIQQLLVRHEYEESETIIEEGEESRDIYLISDGEVMASKWDEEKLFRLPMIVMKEGDMFGEMSFMDGSPRYMSIDTTKRTVLYRLPYDQVTKLEMKDTYNKLVVNILKINSERTRENTEVQVRTMHSSLHHFRVETDQSTLVLILAILLALFNVIHFLPLRASFPTAYPYLEWGYWVALLLPTLYMIGKFHLRLEEIGWGKEGVKKIFIETPVFILMGIVLSLLCFELFPKAIEGRYHYSLNPLSISFYFVYTVAYEFIARGVVQTSLQKLLRDRKGKKAVLMTSAFMTFIPLFSYGSFQWEFFAVAFMANFLLGLIYLRHKNIAGVALIHFAVGLFSSHLAS